METQWSYLAGTKGERLHTALIDGHKIIRRDAGKRTFEPYDNPHKVSFNSLEICLEYIKSLTTKAP
jgi:hypothetical protein